jgi:hypothetical protein
MSKQEEETAMAPLIILSIYLLVFAIPNLLYSIVRFVYELAIAFKEMGKIIIRLTARLARYIRSRIRRDTA